MSRGANYNFVNADASVIEAEITAVYTNITGRSVRAASPEKLFISWITAVLANAYANINYAGNQNIPSRAQGENLDALAELFYNTFRPPARAATVHMRFTISEAQATAVLIPIGTRVTNDSGSIVFGTVEDVYIAIGDTSVHVQALCQITGAAGNGHIMGSITTCVDPFPYYESCVNTDTSGGGSDEATDEEFFDLMVASEDAYSSAGARGAYIYWAKSVSTDIIDVLVNTPLPGQVNIYVLMENGIPVNEEVKKAVLAACNADEVRPLTDYVVVDDPETIDFNIDLKYFISRDSPASAADVENAVHNAVDDYVSWQIGKIGRDINPSKLISMVIAAGAKRVEVTEPLFTRLNDGGDNAKPELAQAAAINIVNGGYEDE